MKHPKEKEQSLPCGDMEGFACLDCAVCTSCTNEYYMIHKALWLSVVPSRKGMLCIACLEKRLGRQLMPEDFTDCLVNTDFGGTRGSELLRSRIRKAT